MLWDKKISGAFRLPQKAVQSGVEACKLGSRVNKCMCGESAVPLYLHKLVRLNVL